MSLDRNKNATVGFLLDLYNNKIKPYLNGQTGASALDELNDVDVTTPSNDDVLKYNSTSGKWENGQGGGGGASALNDLTDVTITSATSGQVLKYDGSKWANGTDSAGHEVKNSSDTTLTQRPTLKFASPITATDDSTNQQTVIDLNTTAQVDFSQFSPPSQMSPGISRFSNLDDVQLSNPTTGQILAYDGGYWVNAPRDYHEYSTSSTEKVVGKWIDKKLIYEKVITTTAPTCSTEGTYVSEDVSVGATVNEFLPTCCAMINISGVNCILPKIHQADAVTTTASATLANHTHPLQFAEVLFRNNSYSDSSKKNKITVGNSRPGYSGKTITIILQYTKV